jgi:hypothetical protein
MSIVGYKKSQVEEMLKTERGNYEKTIKLQKERIFELREEVKILTEKLTEMSKHENAVSKALVDARFRAEEIEQQSLQKIEEDAKLKRAEIEAVSFAAKRTRRVLTELTDTAVNIVLNMQNEIEEVENKLDGMCLSSNIR